MKVCSFLPAVTQMIYDMGLQDQLHGITFECPDQALQEKLKVVRCVLEGRDMSSLEIDQVYSASKANGESLYYVDQPVLESIMPDVIFTQDVCEVCQIDTECTAAAVAKLNKPVDLVPISPDSLADVLNSLHTIARAVGFPDRAEIYEANLKARIDAIIDQQRANRLAPRSVSLLEWIEPIYNCGHWIPDQIAVAGGVDMLSNPKGDSIVTDWDKIVKYDPEVLIIAPCGYRASRTLEDMPRLTEKSEWSNLQAVKNNSVYLVDFDLFTQPSASTLVEGIEVLAALFNPDHFEIPKYLKAKVLHYQREAILT